MLIKSLLWFVQTAKKRTREGDIGIVVVGTIADLSSFSVKSEHRHVSILMHM